MSENLVLREAYERELRQQALRELFAGMKPLFPDNLRKQGLAE